MQYGIFDHLERRSDVGLAQQYEERLQLVQFADEAGIYGYHVAEHHHSPLCLAPNQAVYLAAVAQRTKRLKLGSLVYVLPLHQPIRLIEEICMVDQLSDGRMQIGVGPGVLGGAEFKMWGGDGLESRERFEETLEILRRGLQCEFLTYHGKHFDYDDLWMELRPKQAPHPPFWYAGNAESAARRGMNFIGGGPISAIAQSVERYKALWREGADDAETTRPSEPLYGGTQHIFIADSDEEAHDRVATAWTAYRGHFPKPHSAGNEVVQAAPRAGGPAPETPAVVCGSAATVRHYVQAYVERSGANYFVPAFQWGDLTHKEALHSMTLFATEIMPAIAAAAK